MSLIDRIERMPRALCQKNPGNLSPELPRRIDGRGVDLRGLFETDPVDEEAAALGGTPRRLESIVHGAGPPLQHAVGVETTWKDGRYVRVTHVPERLSRSPAACRLDSYLDLADHAELASCWSMRNLRDRVRDDSLLQAEMLVHYFWGRERDWRLEERPDLELSVRAPPLLGWVTFEDLERAISEVFGGRVTVCLVLEGEPSAAEGNLAAPLQTSGEVAPSGRTRARPPIIGPAPLVAPVLRMTLEPQAHALCIEHGFYEGEYDPEDTIEMEPGWKLAEAIARCYLPPHVGMVRDLHPRHSE